MSDLNDTYRSPGARVMGFFTWKKLVSFVLVIFAILVAMDGIFTTDIGFNYVVQDTALGSKRFFQEPGIHFKIPFASKVTPYKQVATIGFSNTDKTKFTSNHGAVAVTFADTYNGDVPATFRFRLPRDEEKMFALHREFRSMKNLVNALLVKNARNAMVVTATQYTGEEFFQGGLNSYKVKLEDQLRNGLYETERRRVRVEESDLAAVSSNEPREDFGTRITKRARLVWKNIVLTDDNGKALRLRNPLDTYGIEVTQVTIDKPTPESQLQKMLVTKKTLVAKRIAAEQSIVTAEAQAQAVQSEMEIGKRKAIQIADKKRELAIIAGQQRVSVEKQEKAFKIVQANKTREVAVIERKKVLQIAEANKAIELANSEAAVFAAIAIRAKGLAEADVDRAKFAAKESSKDIYMAEVQRDIAIAMYRALPNFKIDMPRNVVMNGSEGKTLPNSLDILTTFGALQIMDQTVGKRVVGATVPLRTRPVLKK